MTEMLEPSILYSVRNLRPLSQNRICGWLFTEMVDRTTGKSALIALQEGGEDHPFSQSSDEAALKGKLDADGNIVVVFPQIDGAI